MSAAPSIAPLIRRLLLDVDERLLTPAGREIVVDWLCSFIAWSIADEIERGAPG